MDLKIVHIFNTRSWRPYRRNEYFHRLYNCPIGIHPYDADMLLNAALNLSDFMYTPIFLLQLIICLETEIAYI